MIGRVWCICFWPALIAGQTYDATGNSCTLTYSCNLQVDVGHIVFDSTMGQPELNPAPSSESADCSSAGVAVNIHLIVLHAVYVLLLHASHSQHYALATLQIRVVRGQLLQLQRQLLHFLFVGSLLLLRRCRNVLSVVTHLQRGIRKALDVQQPTFFLALYFRCANLFFSLRSRGCSCPAPQGSGSPAAGLASSCRVTRRSLAAILALGSAVVANKIMPLVWAPVYSYIHRVLSCRNQLMLCVLRNPHHEPAGSGLVALDKPASDCAGP